MPVLRQDPQQYVVNDCVPYTTASQAATGYTLDFNASRLHLTNARASAVYVALGTSTPTTVGYRTCAGETVAITDVLFSRFAIAATTTTTGTFVYATAWGG